MTSTLNATDVALALRMFFSGSFIRRRIAHACQYFEKHASWSTSPQLRSKAGYKLCPNGLETRR